MYRKFAAARIILLVLHLLIGIGAITGGLSAILEPSGPMGITVDALKNSPFDSFLIPGIFLFAVIGLGNIFCAVLYRFKIKYIGYLSGIFGGILMAWIVIQCIMLLSVVALHVIFFVLGLLQSCLALILLYEKNLFPANILKKIFD